MCMGIGLDNHRLLFPGTRKLAFKLTSGEAAGRTIETVLIPVIRESGQRHRITVCVSSQVGCAMNCQFCLTGRMGLMGEIQGLRRRGMHGVRSLASMGKGLEGLRLIGWMKGAPMGGFGELS